MSYSVSMGPSIRPFIDIEQSFEKKIERANEQMHKTYAYTLYDHILGAGSTFFNQDKLSDTVKRQLINAGKADRDGYAPAFSCNNCNLEELFQLYLIISHYHSSCVISRHTWEAESFGKLLDTIKKQIENYRSPSYEIEDSIAMIENILIKLDLLESNPVIHGVTLDDFNSITCDAFVATGSSKKIVYQANGNQPISDNNEARGSGRITKLENLSGRIKYIIDNIDPNILILNDNGGKLADVEKADAYERVNNAYHASLALANEKQLESVCFTPIATGRFQLSAEESAFAAFDAIKKFSKEFPSSTVRVISIATNSFNDYSSFSGELKNFKTV